MTHVLCFLLGWIVGGYAMYRLYEDKHKTD
jgi:hypothetical protein